MIIFIQIAKWFWALFPALIGIISPTGAYNAQNNLDLQESQLVANSDLLIDSNSDGVPNGFNVTPNSENVSLNNGVFSYTPTAKYSQFLSTNSNSSIVGNIYYGFANVKASTNKIRLLSYNIMSPTAHSGSGNFEFMSFVFVSDHINNSLYISDTGDNSAGQEWLPVSVDYIGAINLTAVFGDNIPDKQDLDDFILSGNRFYFTDGAYDDYNWFDSGFTSESRDILDILGYFFWLVMPIIGIYWVFRLLLHII